MSNNAMNKFSYPLLEKHPELIKSTKGTPLAEITMEQVLDGSVDFDDCKIHYDTLIFQAEIADASGNRQLGENFRRAAELTRIPDEFVLETYNSIRPFRSSKDEILKIADALETTYKAHKNAAFIREALGILEKKHQLKEDSI